VLGRCTQRHRHGEFLRFLNTVESGVAAGKVIHVILGNYATHKRPKVRAWLARHPRLHLPLNPDLGLMDERGRGLFLGPHTTALRRGSFSGIVDLQAAINCYIAEHNDTPKPFVWTKPAAAILDAVNGKSASSV
jgi:hypothetical protein